MATSALTSLFVEEATLQSANHIIVAQTSIAVSDNINAMFDINRD